MRRSSLDIALRRINPDTGDHRLEPDSSAVSMGAQPPLGGVPAVTHKEKRLVAWGELKIQ